METDFHPNHKLNMIDSFSVHHIAPFIVKRQLSGHSYAVPALCEAVSNNIDTHLHTAGKSNLVFKPSFKVHEYRIDFMLKSILSSQKFKSGLKKLTTDGDIIHTHGLWRMPHIYSLSVKKRKNIKIVNSPKGSFAKEALSVSRYKKILFNIFSNQNKMLSNCDAFHATSLKEKDEIRSLGYKQPIAVIPEGIDIPKEKKTNFTREKTKFLYLGRIHPIKGLDLLIKTWSRIELENKNCTLEICGYYEDISYYKFLQDLIKKFGLKNISFTDKVSGLKKQEKYLSNDVFIIPSQSENFGLVIAEAMSYGLPVIVSEETPWHVVKKNNYGWVVSLNQDDIYSAILAANSLNKNDLKNMGQLGRTYIKDYFSWDVLGKDYLAFYDWVRNGGSTPSFMDIF